GVDRQQGLDLRQGEGHAFEVAAGGEDVEAADASARGHLCRGEGFEEAEGDAVAAIFEAGPGGDGGAGPLDGGFGGKVAEVPGLDARAAPVGGVADCAAGLVGEAALEFGDIAALAERLAAGVDDADVEAEVFGQFGRAPGVWGDRD